MAETLCLKAEVREGVGKKSAAKVRGAGRVPAIIYGHKEKPVAVTLDTHNFVEGLHHGCRLMEVQIGKKKETVFVKDLQYDYLGKNIIHADLVRVDVTETIKVAVPIELKGTAKGTNEGGVVEEHVDHLEIECRAGDVPETIIVWVKEVDVGDTVHASDIELPAGVKLVSEPSTVLVTCSLVAAAKSTEELEAEAPVAPEVISEAKEAEEADKADKTEEGSEEKGSR